MPPQRDRQPIRTVGVVTADLGRLADGLRPCGVATVVLESTGVYGRSWRDFLEAQGFEVLVVDPRTRARHWKQKTDVCDAAWRQELHRFGTRKRRFRPAHEVRALRTGWRHRDPLVTEAAQLLQLRQLLLVQRNVSLHLAVADRAGATGRRMPRALCQGPRDPPMLAALRDSNGTKTQAEIAQALEGTWDTAPRFEWKQLLEAWDCYQHQLPRCDQEYEKAAGNRPDQTRGRSLPQPDQRPRKHRNRPTAFDRDALIFPMTGVPVTAVDGPGARTVRTVRSETGPDRAATFATDQHVAAGTTRAPRRPPSGPRTQCPAPTARRVANAFRLAARALGNRESVLGHCLRRLRARLGLGTAIRATACQRAKRFDRLLPKGEAYRRQRTAAEEAKQRERQLKALDRKARELGLPVIPA